MSEPIRESSPMIGPDSLRKINQVNKAFFETHTKRNYGRADVYGSQYSGTVENFGFEMLLESRKLKMQKPSLKVKEIRTDFFQKKMPKLITLWKKK